MARWGALTAIAKWSTRRIFPCHWRGFGVDSGRKLLHNLNASIEGGGRAKCPICFLLPKAGATIRLYNDGFLYQGKMTSSESETFWEWAHHY